MHDAFDIRWATAGMNTSANTYTITIRGNTTAGTVFQIAGTTTPNQAIASATAGGNGDFTLTTQVNADTLAAIGSPRQFAAGFRVQTTNNADFTISELRITR
jgi:hypothetical protein